MKMKTTSKDYNLSTIAVSLLLINTLVTMLLYDPSVKWWYWFNKAVQYLLILLLIFDRYNYELVSFINFIYKTAYVCAFSLMIYSLVRMAGFQMTTIAFAFMFLFFLIIAMISGYYARNKRNRSRNRPRRNS